MTSALKLAFLAKSDPDSGNFNTAFRICSQLVAARPTWTYKIVPVLVDSSNTNSNTCQQIQNQHLATLSGADVLLCLHFYRCAPIVSRLIRAGFRLPMAIVGIAGGTDLNVDAEHQERRFIMREFVRGCRHIVVFSQSLLHSLSQLMAEDTCIGESIPVSVIPQGICTGTEKQDEKTASDYLVHTTDDELAVSQRSLVQFERYFIIVGRIRPVKNCCSVLEPFCRWRSQATDDSSSGVRLLFVGDIEDSNYGEMFKAQLAKSPNVHLLPGIHHRQVLQLMRNSLGLINCSLSEGQSNSILEAMSIGVPTIVSSIPGNLDLVQHLNTGFVFKDGEQLIQWLNVTTDEDPESRRLVQRITNSAKVFVQEKHSPDKELQAYIKIISDCCGLSA